jgi:hypothetical protein
MLTWNSGYNDFGNIKWFLIFSVGFFLTFAIVFLILLIFFRHRQGAKTDRGGNLIAGGLIVSAAIGNLLLLITVSILSSTQLKDFVMAKFSSRELDPGINQSVEPPKNFAETVTPVTLGPTMEPTPTMAPLQATSTLPITTSQASQINNKSYSDDFSNPLTGWRQEEKDYLMVGYSEGGLYGIALKKAGASADVLIPHPLALPIKESDLNYRARPVQGKGYFGVLCDYIDNDNQIIVGITDGNYTIARYENNELKPFFDPFWVKDQNIRSENGEFQVSVHCGDTIQLMVNGYQLPAAENPDRTMGDIGILAGSNKDSVVDPEFSYEVLIDDVYLEVN